MRKTDHFTQIQLYMDSIIDGMKECQERKKKNFYMHSGDDALTFVVSISAVPAYNRLFHFFFYYCCHQFDYSYWPIVMFKSTKSAARDMVLESLFAFGCKSKQDCVMI